MRNDWLAAADEALVRDCTLDFHKASGNGGQKVNKTSSAVRLTHAPSGVTVSCAESRSQHENRRLALKMLRMKIAFTIRSEADPAFRIGEPVTSVKNDAYPLFAAKLLDAFSAHGCDLKETALMLNVSASKLTKILYRDPALWIEANNMRNAHALPPLRPPQR